MAEILRDTFHLQLNVNADGTARTGAFNAGSTKTITGATNASPIVITATAHGFLDGQLVFITGIGGNTAGNGWHEVANKTTNTFELRYSSGNAAYTSGGTATLDPPRFNPVFQDGFAAGESVSRVDVPTEHKDRGIRYAVPGDRNRAAHQMRTPIFPELAGFQFRMASRYHPTTNLPYYHTARQWWTGTLAGTDPDIALEFAGVMPTGFSMSVNRQTIGPLELNIDFFINAERGLTAGGGASLPTIPSAPLGWPVQDPYISSNVFVDIEFADANGAFTAWTGNRSDLRTITITANENPELDISSPNDDVALDNSWTAIYLGTPTVTVDAELKMAHTDYLRITRLSSLRKARVRFMAVGRTPTGTTTSATALAASGTALVVGSNTGFHVGDYLLLSQGTANLQQVVQCQGLTGSTGVTISAALIAMDGSAGDTIKVRNCAFEVMVHSMDCSDRSPPTSGGAVKVLRFRGDARLTPTVATLYTLKAYDDDNAGKTPS